MTASLESWKSSAFYTWFSARGRTEIFMVLDSSLGENNSKGQPRGFQTKKHILLPHSKKPGREVPNYLQRKGVPHADNIDVFKATLEKA